jgi:truncated hemoglobin YjbI
MAEVKSMYEQLGGGAKVRALVDRFYDIMDYEPEAKLIRAMHREVRPSAAARAPSAVCY